MKRLLCILIVLIISGIGCNSKSRVSNNFIGHWEGFLIAEDHRTNVVLDISDVKCTYDVPEAGLYSQIVTDFSFNDNGFNIVADPKKPVVLEGSLVNGEMTGKASGLGTISFKKISSTPQFFSEEEVNYKSGDIKLSGTLIKPAASGIYPVVVMIHGSGGQGKMTRNTTRSMAAFFVKNGIAALIYDRRGNGKSEGQDDRILKMELLAMDAASGVEYLSTRNDIDKNKIGVYGLSQGGWVAPYVYNFTDKVNFVITISAPGITPDEQDSFSTDNYVTNLLDGILKNAGVPESENHERLEDPEIDKDVEIVPGFSHFDPLPYWKKIKSPVLAIWGSEDRLVPAEKSKGLIEDALKQNGNTSYTTKIFPRGDHQLKLFNPDNKNKETGIKPMVPGFQEFVAEWMKGKILKK